MNHEQRRPLGRFQSWKGIVSFGVNQDFSWEKRLAVTSRGRHASPYIGSVLLGQGIDRNDDHRRVFPASARVDRAIRRILNRTKREHVCLFCRLQTHEASNVIGAVEVLKVTVGGPPVRNVVHHLPSSSPRPPSRSTSSDSPSTSHTPLAVPRRWKPQLPAS